jgi:hypothetical protein
MTGWCVLSHRPAELVVPVPGVDESALPHVKRALERFGAATQEQQGGALSATLPARKVLGWEYGDGHAIPCTVKPAAGGSHDGGGVVAICDVSVVRGRKRPFAYIWSAATVVIGVIEATAGRGVTGEGLVAFLVALLGPWVILQLLFFQDCFRVRTRVSRLIGSWMLSYHQGP